MANITFIFSELKIFVRSDLKTNPKLQVIVWNIAKIFDLINPVK